MSRFYAGIGSRETPPEVLETMEKLAAVLANRGWILRSGHADGADSAFEDGVLSSSGEAEIFIPWEKFGKPYNSTHKVRYICNVTDEAMKIAKNIHPAWVRCSEWVKKLHARNVQQVFGENLNEPVDFIICWTPDGKIQGGTATAINLAITNNIPVFNLAVAHEKKLLKAYLTEKQLQ